MVKLPVRQPQMAGIQILSDGFDDDDDDEVTPGIINILSLTHP